MDVSISDTPVGRLVDGRYRIDATVDRGGMATVYRAVDTRLERPVALKIMHPQLADDDEFVARFISEARAAARLSDPHVVAVFDQGEDGDDVYLAMEFIEGRTLRDVLREHRRLDHDVALEILESVLSALAAAHRAGIVHRDVKPENVLVGDDGRIKVADFGLARALGTPSNATRGLLLGTVNYISPEQALGEPATTRSDVYSAGILLYELLTGIAPHVGATDFVVVRSHIDEDVPPPSESVPVPAAVDDLVLTATARDPGSRFGDAGGFLVALRRARAMLAAAPENAEPDLDAGAEPREAAGVGLAEALESTVMIDSLEMFDEYAAPTATDAAAVPVRAAAAPPATAHTRVIETPPAEPLAAGIDRRRRRADDSSRAASGSSRRGVVMFIAVLVLAIAIAVGAWWLGAGRWTSAPSLLNMDADAAVAAAAEVGLEAVPGGAAFSEVVEPGLIVSTDPEPGGRVVRGGEVVFVVSKGPERYEVPDLSGRTRDDAEAALSELNLRAEITEEHHDDVPEGEVVSQGIEAGQEVKRDTAVPVVVSLGREPVEIPDFTGRARPDAEKGLREAGLTVEVDEEKSSSVAPGVVISQDPSGGTGFRGDTVHLVVSEGRGEEKVPDVTGKRLEEAEDRLTEAGFVVEVRGVVPTFGDRDDQRVLRQEPSGGRLPEGSTVVLYVF